VTTISVAARPLGIAEAARHLGVHPNTIRKAERAGRIPRVRREPVSGYRIFSVEEVEQLRQRFFGRV